MDAEEREIIGEIRDALHNYELPYEQGQWEAFQKQHGAKLAPSVPIKPRRSYWGYAAAAAMLLLGVIFYHRDTPKEAELVQQGLELPPTELDSKPSEVVAPLEETVPNTLPKRKTTKLIARQVEPKTDMTPPEFKNIKRTRTPIAVVSMPYTQDQDAAPDFLTIAENSESRPGDRNAEPSGDSRWSFGVELHSAYASEQFNFGGGVLTQFKVSEKVSLSTGLAYATLAAVHNETPVQMSAEVKRIGSESEIKALDIPLSVIYEASEGWYASAGVSAMAVLDENKMYTMESETLQESMLRDPESGATVSVFNVVKHQYQETAEDTDFAGRNDLNFLNFSIGKRQTLYRNHDLMIEPYIKIPLGTRQGDVNLLRSGIKLKIVF